MTKAILFDADGVTLIKQGYLSEKLSRDFNIPLDQIMPFFRNDYRLCQENKLDLKVVLPKYLEQWKIQKSVADFLDYWFSADTKPDKIMIEKIQTLRNEGIKCYLASDQEKYRAEYILNVLKFSEYFDKCFFSYNVGNSKSNPDFFKKVLEELKLNPNEVVYFDDDQKNVEVAKSLGIDAHYFTNINDMEYVAGNK